MKEIEKQAIEEMENDLRECHSEFETDGDIYTDYQKTAERMIGKGWRKQSEGEWVEKHTPWDMEGSYTYVCSKCDEQISVLGNKLKFCPNCGAKMKGGAE